MKLMSSSFPSPADAAPIPSAPTSFVTSPASGELRALRNVLPELYFVNTPYERVNRHLEILRRLGDSLDTTQEKPPRILDFYLAPERTLVECTECTFCAFDEGEPGLLAKMCGLMLWLNLRVHTAFIYTLDNGSSVLAEGARPIALDTFLLSERHFGHDHAISAKTQARLQQEIHNFLQGETTMAPWLSRARRRSLAALEIHDLRLENFAHDVSTRLTLSAANDPSILYRITKALSQLKLNIRAAQISTYDATSNDIFFLSDIYGQRLDDNALAPLVAQLRALLEDSTSFGPDGA